MATENTHCDVVAAAGGTAAADTNLGSITFPAGGPWIVHNLLATIATVTATAAESVNGYIKLVTASGDITPQPAPAKFPLIACGSPLGATIDQSVCPLHDYPLNYTAAGKAVVEVHYIADIASTAAPKIVCGLMFGLQAPAVEPVTYVERARAAVTAVAATSLGTMQLSQNASMITGVMFMATQNGVLVAGEELTGYGELRSDDVDLTPFKIPFLWAVGAGLGATIMGAHNLYTYFIPVAIPVKAGARITAYSVLSTAVTNAAEVTCYLAYK